MKLIYTKTPNTLTISKEYAPGEKYLSSFKWDYKNGKVTPEKVEDIIPNSRFIRATQKQVFDTILNKVTFTLVTVEQTA